MNEKVPILDVWEFAGRVGVFFAITALLSKNFSSVSNAVLIINMFVGIWALAPLYKMFFENKYEEK